MITEVQFNTLNENSKNFKYSMFEYFDFDEVESADIICNNADLILLCKKLPNKVQIYFAANQVEHIINSIEKINDNIHLVFFIPELVNVFEDIGFVLKSEWIDFFNNDILNTPTSFKNYNDIQFLQSDKADIISEMTNLCAGQSRGFEPEEKEWFVDWLKENDIIVLKDGDILIGYNCVSIYDNGNIVWIRRIAINPAYQNKGHGKSLIEQALVYGINKGAKRSFLAADVLNEHAVSLYKKYGFVPQSEHGEIAMDKLKRYTE